MSRRGVVRFPGWELDPSSRELRRRGHGKAPSVRLAEKPFLVLEALATRQELVDRLWPDGTRVDFDNNLNTAVGARRPSLLASRSRIAGVLALLAAVGFLINRRGPAAPLTSLSPKAVVERFHVWDLERHEGHLVFLGGFPELSELRSDPRFRALAERIGLIDGNA